MLPKTPDEKETYESTFDQFFRFEDVAGDTVLGEAESEGDGEGGEGAGDGEGQGDGTGSGSSGKGKKKGKFSAIEQEEEEEDLGPGEMSQPHSPLGQLLMQDSRVELTVQMADAAKAIKLEDIQVFTQKGLYTRKIMEEMGLADLQREIADAKQSGSVPQRRLGQELKKRRDWLREQVRDYVEKQFLLHADAQGLRLREELLRKVKLSNVEHRNFRLVQEDRVQDGEKARLPAFATQESIQTRPAQHLAHDAPQHELRRPYFRSALEIGEGRPPQGLCDM